MADKPKTHLSIAALEAEIGDVEPFTLALSNSKQVTFPDFGAMPADEAEEFIEVIEGHGKKDFRALKDWLSPEDFEKYRDAKIPLRTHVAVMQRVGDYYKSTIGTAGEGAASES